jgi:hypothetical protein
MRRLVVIFAFAVALAAPASTLASHASIGDGTLVVQNGAAPKGVPVVAMTINGAVIGHVGHGRIVIDDPTPNNRESPEVTGWESRKDGPTATAQTWSGIDMSFRAVDGTYYVLVYGSDVDLVAVGRGSVTLAGTPDTPIGDGKYSLNGDPFRSLPGTPTKLLTIGSFASGG